MHKLINAAGRRKAGMAAGAVLAGGLAGGVLLAPGTAYAATTNTTTAITGTTQTQTSQGTTLWVHVSVTGSGPGWPAGTVAVSLGSASCTAALAEAGGSSVGAGSCSLSGLSGGSYTLTASYQGSSDFTGSSTSETVTVGGGGGGGGQGSGQPGYDRASVSTYLSCTSKVYTGTQGTCTLYVTNTGRGSARDVTAQIALPSQLRAISCGYYYYGCSTSGNTASEDLGTLNRGQTRELTVTFTAKTGYNLWGWHRGHRFTVKVTGSASSDNGFPFYGNQSSSAAYVTVIPRGWWA
jgi:Bacterial Ig-like domain (group 3)/Domain of unknown function DUF11